MAPSTPTGEGDPARARRRARARRGTRRRRALSAAALLAAAALALTLALSGGASPRRAGKARARPRSASAHASTAASSPARTHARPRSSYPETARVRRLIALGRPIYCTAARGNEVALTFDDGPGPYTRLVLAKLRKHRVSATFFVVARNIGLVGGATRAERLQGAVGDHTVTHPLLTSLGRAEAQSEIVRAKSAIERSSGAPVFLFRPPYGGRNGAIDSMVHAQGMLEIMWTVDSADSLGADYAGIEHNVISGLRPGAIILMHENHGQTVRALLGIFAALKRRHLRAVSVPQLLTDDPPSRAMVRAPGGGCHLAPGVARGGG